jgi:TolB protein
VPNSGSPPSCVPLTWWNANTVLASCSVTGSPHASRLWLVPANGNTPTPLTDASGIAEGSYVVTGAWQGPGAVYVTETNARQCAGAASGPGGLAVATVAGGSLQPVSSISGTTNNHTSVLAALDSRLLLLAQTSCPGTSSLLWLNPANGATQTVLSPAANQAGVISAVPYGNGPTAITGG